MSGFMPPGPRAGDQGCGSIEQEQVAIGLDHAPRYPSQPAPIGAVTGRGASRLDHVLDGSTSKA